jgi:phospholipid-binding lipoprotein MlaA
MKFPIVKVAATALCASFLLGAPSEAAKPKNKAVPTPPVNEQPVSVNDPLEPLNRGIFEFNDIVDKLILKPVAIVYSTVLPRPVQDGVSNVFGNLDDVFTGLNNVLQGKPERAGKDFGRVIVNTTLGIGGLFDVGAMMGLEKAQEDFGQTLGVWGVAPGPYLVLPVFGPSSVRDAVGTGLRIAADPRRHLPDAWEWPLFGINLVSTRAQGLRTDGLLETASFDRYGFARSSYLMRRESLVRDKLSSGGSTAAR